jgi:hypothetical protein
VRRRGAGGGGGGACASACFSSLATLAAEEASKARSRSSWWRIFSLIFCASLLRQRSSAATSSSWFSMYAATSSPRLNELCCARSSCRHTEEPHGSTAASASVLAAGLGMSFGTHGTNELRPASSAAPLLASRRWLRHQWHAATISYGSESRLMGGGTSGCACHSATVCAKR